MNPASSMASGGRAGAAGGSSADTLSCLGQLFAELIEAGNRYLHLLVTTKGLDQLVVAELFAEGMRRCLADAQQVARRIVQLGGVPSLDVHLQFEGFKCSGKEAISTALAFEQAALDLYRDLLERCGDDTSLQEFAQSKIASQSEQVARLYMLLEP